MTPIREATEMTSSQQDAAPESKDEAAVKTTTEGTDQGTVEDPNHKPKKPVPVKDPWDMGGTPSQPAG
jgi:hypothetical protein